MGTLTQPKKKTTKTQTQQTGGRGFEWEGNHAGRGFETNCTHSICSTLYTSTTLYPVHRCNKEIENKRSVAGGKMWIHFALIQKKISDTYNPFNTQTQLEEHLAFGKRLLPQAFRLFIIVVRAEDNSF